MNELNRLKAQFLEHLLLKDYSPGSIYQIDRSLRLFLQFLLARRIETVPPITPQLIEEFKAAQANGIGASGRPYVVATIQSRMYDLKGWFRWMKKRGVISWDPSDGVRAPKCVKRLPSGVLRQDEIRRVLAKPDLDTALGYRDRTMMEVLYSTGVRASELVNLRIPDVDLKKKVARVRKGKGGKDRFAPLSTPTCRFLERYLEKWRPELVDGPRQGGRGWAKNVGTAGDFVFVSSCGGKYSAGCLTDAMRRYIVGAGISRRFQPVHVFRHSIATHLLESGMDVRYVQVFLGHESINSTQVYTHVERETLHRKFRECHPRELAKEAFIPFVEAKKHVAA